MTQREDHEQHPEPNPEVGEPEEGGTLPGGARPQGEAMRERADEWGPKAGKGGHEGHGAGEHDHPH